MAKKGKKHTDSTGSSASDAGVDTSSFDANDRAIASLFGNAGVAAGKGLSDKFYKEGSLGSVSTEVPGVADVQSRYQQLMTKYANPSAEQSDAMSRMQAGLGGYTSGEYQASREQMQRGLNSNLQTGLGQLAKSQARGKVYGAAASAQQANMITGAQQSKDNLEQDLMLKNIDEQQKRLQSYGQFGNQVQAQTYQAQQGLAGDYAKSVESANTQQLDREKINMGNRAAEQAGRIGAFTGSGALALTAEQARAMNRINQQGLAALR